ncbi:hypothetical protein D3C75_1098660 [compost metagenome]
MQRRNVLARVEQASGVECGFDGMEQGQFIAVELRAHLIDFFPTDTMLAGNTAADLHTQFQNLAAKRFGPLQFTRLVGVEQNQRVHVAVTSMKYVGYP